MRQSQAPRGLLSLRNEMQVDSCGVTKGLVAPAAQARRSASPTLPGEKLPAPGTSATPPLPGPTTDSCRPKTTIVRNSGLAVGQGVDLLLYKRFGIPQISSFGHLPDLPMGAARASRASAQGGSHHTGCGGFYPGEDRSAPFHRHLLQALSLIQLLV